MSALAAGGASSRRCSPSNTSRATGSTIHGYLTLPKGVRGASNLPVVVNVHGGPWARDVWGFNPEVQFLANRGYAVLQVNFRGSTGYGRKFWEASFTRVGPQDAGRHHRRRAVADRGRHRRSDARRDLRRQLRRLRDAGGTRLHARPVRRRRRLRGRVEPPHLHEGDPALLEAVSRDAAGDGRRHGEGRGDAARGLAGVQRRQDQGAAADRAGRQGSARGEERERPDGGRDAQARRGSGVPREGQRGPRLPQRGEPLRVLRGDGAVPGQAHRQRPPDRYAASAACASRTTHSSNAATRALRGRYGGYAR